MTLIIFTPETKEDGTKLYHLAADRNISDSYGNIVYKKSKIEYTPRFIVSSAGSTGTLAIPQLMSDYFESYKERLLEKDILEFYVQNKELILACFATPEEDAADVLIIDRAYPDDAFSIMFTATAVITERLEGARCFGCGHVAQPILQALAMSKMELNEDLMKVVFVAVHRSLPIISEDFDYIVWDSEPQFIPIEPTIEEIV